MTAPLTTARMGSRLCPGCEHRLDDGRSLTEVEGVDAVRNRYGGFSDGRTRPVTRRWHSECLSAFEASNAEYRARVEADRLDMIREIGRSAGWTDERIDAAVEKARAS